MAVEKSADGQSVKVTRTLTKVSPEQKRQEVELFVNKSIVSEVSGFLFKVRTRLQQGIYPVDRAEVDTLIKAIMEMPQLIESQVNPSASTKGSEPSETNPDDPANEQVTVSPEA